MTVDAVVNCNVCRPFWPTTSPNRSGPGIREAAVDSTVTHMLGRCNCAWTLSAVSENATPPPPLDCHAPAVIAPFPVVRRTSSCMAKWPLPSSDDGVRASDTATLAASGNCTPAPALELAESPIAAWNSMSSPSVPALAPRPMPANGIRFRLDTTSPRAAPTTTRSLAPETGAPTGDVAIVTPVIWDPAAGRGIESPSV